MKERAQCERNSRVTNVGEHSRRPQDSGKPWNLEEEEEE
jgi:hypothetical protein